MKENKLVSYVEQPPSSPAAGLTAIERASERMDRWTRYWPMTIGSTIVFNMGNHVDQLTKLVVERELTDDQVVIRNRFLILFVGDLKSSDNQSLENYNTNKIQIHFESY